MESFLAPQRRPSTGLEVGTPTPFLGEAMRPPPKPMPRVYFIEEGAFLDPESDKLLESGHGWPARFYIIGFPNGTYAANNVDTKGLEPDPMEMRGLACHHSTDSVKIYLRKHTGLPEGALPIAVSYGKARDIAIERNLDCLLMFDGIHIRDVEYLK